MVKWTGSTTCDICGKECSKVGEYMFDSPVDHGSWALTCASCYPRHRCSKMGQVYDIKTKEKIADIRNFK